MMFLLKAAFWVGLMLVLLPTGSDKNKQAADAPQLKVAEAASAATSAVSDLSHFCTRQPETCAVGSQVASILAQRAQDGAVMVYEFITERAEHAGRKTEVVPVRHKAAVEERNIRRGDTTGSIDALLPRARPASSQDTLTGADRRPSWRAPALRQQASLDRDG
jgi:hypothetical protein